MACGSCATDLFKRCLTGMLLLPVQLNLSAKSEAFQSLGRLAEEMTENTLRVTVQLTSKDNSFLPKQLLELSVFE